MIYDQDCSGTVSVDETMEMLYTRYGKTNLEQKMTELFGADMKSADGDGELSFWEYLDAVKREDEETQSHQGKVSRSEDFPLKAVSKSGRKPRPK
jgi:hypothetical protein